ncbi:MAG: hypothetical protein J5929_01825 [Eubacterium sp.]|nr:hypothetical protein [Eubacterium sp.]
MEEDGIIGFIGAETNAESDALYNGNNIITPVYNDSIDLENDCCYDDAVNIFLDKMKTAEEAVKRGEYKTSEEVHILLGI